MRESGCSSGSKERRATEARSLQVSSALRGLFRREHKNVGEYSSEAVTAVDVYDSMECSVWGGRRFTKQLTSVSAICKSR